MYSYYDALMNVEDLMGLDYIFAKVMLYMCPHNDLVVVLQKVDPILASKFYIWYVKNHGKVYITKAKDPEVTNSNSHAPCKSLWHACMPITKMTSVAGAAAG